MDIDGDVDGAVDARCYDVVTDPASKAMRVQGTLLELGYS